MVIKSFRTKLALSFLALALFPLIFAAFILDKRLEENALEEIKSSLFKQALLVESYLRQDRLDPENRQNLETVVKHLAQRVNARITVIHSDGIVLADSEKTTIEAEQLENHLNRPEIRQAKGSGIGSEVRRSPTLNIDMLYLAVPIGKAESPAGFVRLALGLSQVQEMLSSTRNVILLSLLFALALAAVIGVLLVRSIVSPINKIMYASRRFGQGEFAHRIHHDAQDELGALAKILNRMAGDLEDRIRHMELQNQQLRSVFQSMIEGIILVDKRGVVLSVNPTIEKIFNVAKEDVEGKLFLETIRNTDIAQVFQDILLAQKAVSRELTIVWPVKKTFQINAAPIFEAGSVTGCLLVIHDITEIRRLETIRSDFVANVSHELKTPLTSIKGFVETLRDGALDDKENALHFLEIIREHTDRLNNLINDLLDLSCLESEKAVLKKEEISLGALIERVVSAFQAQVKEKGIQIQNEVSQNSRVLADKAKLEQVLTNLIDNAIKFNKETGVIRIFASRQDAGVKVTVEDSGSGIPVKDIPRIFERFYRVDKARSRALGGTGLGLAIVKHIVELHGGAVGVESTEGHGSSFWFTLS